MVRWTGKIEVNHPIVRDKSISFIISSRPCPSKERERLYWQSDHLRLFGRDYGDRLSKAGFKVTESDYINELDPKLVERYALPKNEKVYFCEKI